MDPSCSFTYTLEMILNLQPEWCEIFISLETDFFFFFFFGLDRMLAECIKESNSQLFYFFFFNVRNINQSFKL